MQTFFRAAPALALAVVVGCTEVLPPTAPASVVTLQTRGPDDARPGETAQFLAVALLSNQRYADVTSETAFSTSEPGVLTVAPNGAAVAHAPGTAIVSATYSGQTSLKPVVVMPAGTFRVGGFVMELGSSTAEVLATVEVIAGTGVGLKAVAVPYPGGDYPPGYILRGVAGAVTIAASATGYLTQTIEVDVQGDTRLDITMMPAAPGGN